MNYTKRFDHEGQIVSFEQDGVHCSCTTAINAGCEHEQAVVKELNADSLFLKGLLFENNEGAEDWVDKGVYVRLFKSGNVPVCITVTFEVVQLRGKPYAKMSAAIPIPPVHGCLPPDAIQSVNDARVSLGVLLPGEGFAEVRAACATLTSAIVSRMQSKDGADLQGLECDSFLHKSPETPRDILNVSSMILTGLCIDCLAGVGADSAVIDDDIPDL